MNTFITLVGADKQTTKHEEIATLFFLPPTHAKRVRNDATDFVSLSGVEGYFSS